MERSSFKIMQTVILDNDLVDIPAMDVETAEVISSLLSHLELYSVTGALNILDLAKRVILECTQLHDKYEP